jgi:hypothetical protein
MCNAVCAIVGGSAPSEVLGINAPLICAGVTGFDIAVGRAVDAIANVAVCLPTSAIHMNSWISRAARSFKRFVPRNALIGWFGAEHCLNKRDARAVFGYASGGVAMAFVSPVVSFAVSKRPVRIGASWHRAASFRVL